MVNFYSDRRSRRIVFYTSQRTKFEGCRFLCDHHQIPMISDDVNLALYFHQDHFEQFYNLFLQAEERRLFRLMAALWHIEPLLTDDYFMEQLGRSIERARRFNHPEEQYFCCVIL